MTNEQQDALVGRVIRESKAAESELSQLLVQAEQVANDIAKLAQEVRDRVERARNIRLSGVGGYVFSDAGIENLRDYTKAVDLDSIEKLDQEIGQAVAKACDLRKQKQQIGL